MSDFERYKTSEVTKGYSAKGSKDFVYLWVTWEWNNGFNLVDSRRATEQEIAEYLAKR
jgi:hypothetical protein